MRLSKSTIRENFHIISLFIAIISLFGFYTTAHADIDFQGDELSGVSTDRTTIAGSAVGVIKVNGADMGPSSPQAVYFEFDNAGLNANYAVSIQCNTGCSYSTVFSDNFDTTESGKKIYKFTFTGAPNIDNHGNYLIRLLRTAHVTPGERPLIYGGATSTTAITCTTPDNATSSLVCTNTSPASALPWFYLDMADGTDFHLNTHLVSMKPSYKTVPTNDVHFEYNMYLGTDLLSTIDPDPTNPLYPFVCFQFIDGETASTTYRFPNAIRHCDSNNLNTFEFPLATFKYDPGAIGSIVGGTFDTRLHNGYTAILVSVRSSDDFILYATTTEIVVGSSTVKTFDQYNDETPDQSPTGGCTFDIGDYDNLSTLDKAVLSFKVGVCELLIPKKSDISSIINTATTSILYKFPWGYATRFIAIISSTATSSLPTFTATVLTSSTSSTTLSFDPGDMISGGGALLQSIHDPVNNKTPRDIFEPIVQLVVAMAVIFTIVADVMGTHRHQQEIKSGDNKDR